jgi:hypothetical protein
VCKTRRLLSLAAPSVKARASVRKARTPSDSLTFLVELIDLFAGNAEFIDSLGRVWIREDMWKGFDTLFAPYAKKNAAYAVEATPVDAGEVLVGRVLWKNALLASEERIWMHQMTVLLVLENEDWLVRLIHVTPVKTT